MNDIEKLMARLHATVAYRQFHDPITEGQMQSRRQAGPLREAVDAPPRAEPVDRAPTARVAATVSPLAQPPAGAQAQTAILDVFVIEPKTEAKVAAPPPAAQAPTHFGLQGYAPVAPTTAPVQEAPRSLSEIFAQLQAPKL